jgi:hypothetical protein
MNLKVMFEIHRIIDDNIVEWFLVKYLNLINFDSNRMLLKHKRKRDVVCKNLVQKLELKISKVQIS